MEREKERKRYGQCCLQAALFVLLSFIEYVTLETFLQGDIVEIGFSYGLRNVLLLMGGNLFLVSLFHRIRPAFFLSEGAVLLLGAVNYFVDAFRGYGIVYMDIYAAGTAASVAGEYSYHLGSSFWLGLLTGAAGLVLTWVATDKRKVCRRKRTVLSSAAGIAAAVAFFLWVNFGSSFFSDVSSLTWDHNIGMSDYGYLLYVTANAGEATVEPPDGYSPERAEEILSRYEDPSETNSVLASHAGKAESPNIIMIMNESFSDLDVLGTIDTDKKPLAFFQRIRENAIRGTVHSSVYGGYTANSEFEFLTGCTKAFIPGNPYLQYIEDYLPDIISNIKAQGRYKEAVAVHPYHASGYNRNRVYPLLGFDDFLSIDDFQNPKLVRKYISDESDYRMLEKLYEQKQAGSSLCVFNVTMQNHSAYDDRKYVFEDPVRIKNYSLQPEAEQYLSLMKMSDEALEGLLSYFEKVEEPTIIVLFGDHQPHLPDYFYQKVMGRMPDKLTEEQSMQRYEVPFLIWANYDIGEQTIKGTSINYLSALMMQTAGLQLTDFQRFLMDMYQYVPSVSAGGYYDRRGAFHNWNEQGSEEAKWLEEYEIVQYNYLFDKENRLDRHFQIGREK